MKEHETALSRPIRTKTISGIALPSQTKEPQDQEHTYSRHLLPRQATQVQSPSTTRKATAQKRPHLQSRLPLKEKSKRNPSLNSKKKDHQLSLPPNPKKNPQIHLHHALLPPLLRPRPSPQAMQLLQLHRPHSAAHAMLPMQIQGCPHCCSLHPLSRTWSTDDSGELYQLLWEWDCVAVDVW